MVLITLYFIRSDGLYNDLITLFISNCRFNATKYRDLLRNRVIPKLREKYPIPEEIYFVQDRCPIHQARIIQNLLRDEANLTLITLPPKGSDMNPIENLWGLIVRSLEIDPQWTKEEFVGAVFNAWRRETSKQEQIVNLSLSMKRRLQAVINADGYWTKY